MTSVNSQVVFITGGAHGIGAEVARRLHAKGAKLVLTDVDVAALAAISGELGGDERVLTVVADVRDLAAMNSAAEQAVTKFGGIDVVVANAGIASYGSVLQVDPLAFQRVIDINLVGVFHTVRATLPAVIGRKGYVLIVSSLAAFAAAPGMSPYDASKAGVEHLANALRLEVAGHGVTVGSAHMSWIDTALVRDSKADLPSFTELLSKLPVAAEQNHVGGRLRGSVRQGHRAPQEAGLLPRLGGLAPLAQAGAVDPHRRERRGQDGDGAAAPDGRGSQGTGPIHQRLQPGAGQALVCDRR